MKNTLETRLGIFFVLAAIASVIILEMVGGFNLFKRGYRLHALFNTVQDLKIGDPVKLAGVQVGRVEKISLTNNQVKVTFKMNEDAEVRTDSKATIKFVGLMGQNFVSLDFGVKGTKAEPETYLQAAEQPDLSALMAKLDDVATGVQNITKSFSGDNISNLLGPFTDFLKQNSAPLTAMIGNMKVVSDRVVNGDGTVGKLINDDALYNSSLYAVSNLVSVAEEMKLTLGNARSIVDQINSGQGTLGKLTKDETLYRETTLAMTNIREVMEKINRGEGSVGKLINDESLLRNVKLSLQKLDKATEGLEDAGPLSVLGTAVNSLF
jgi:phospholipid/cholesterol/gamma-HCH transport system substrate-binding protein